VSETGTYASPEAAPKPAAAPPRKKPDTAVRKAVEGFERHADEVVADGSGFSVVSASVPDAKAAPAKPAPKPAAKAAVGLHPTDAAIRKRMKVKDPEARFDFAECTDLEFLGAGAVGAVYKAKNAQGKTVALKACADYDSGDKTFRRFLQERRVVKELRHPGIIAVHEVAIHEEIPYFVMDFVEGKKLSELLKERPSRDALLDMVTKLTETVVFAHGKNIVLRDVRPDNVMVREPDGVPILMDLGFAKDTSSDLMLTGVDMKIGTPLYTAPEVQLNPKNASQQSDIFSLGAILFEATTGKPPYFAKNTPELIALMTTKDAPAATSVDPTSPLALDAVCAKALAREPKDRFATSRAFLEELEKARKAPPPPPPKAPGFFSRLLAKLGIGKA
jgi:serine/threonine protein kinase